MASLAVSLLSQAQVAVLEFAQRFKVIGIHARARATFVMYVETVLNCVYIHLVQGAMNN